jgi:hypothetical protein
LIIFQLAEVTCYLALHQFILKHNNEMVKSKIISGEIYKSRKQIHIISLTGQIYGFIVEVVYLVFVLIVRLIGVKFLNVNILDAANALKMTEFGVIATVQVFMSPELRQKFLSVFKRN